MATLTYQQATATGATVTMAAASAGGDKVRPNPNGAVLVRNADASPHTVTVAVPGNTKYGQADPDITVTVAAGAFKLIGPLPQDLASSVDGLVALTYDGVTSVTVAAVAI
jgi:hypothetical protein